MFPMTWRSDWNSDLLRWSACSSCCDSRSSATRWSKVVGWLPLMTEPATLCVALGGAVKDSSRGEEGWLRDRGAGLFRMLEVRNFKASVGP